MSIGNGGRGRARVRLRLRADGTWWYLSRTHMAFVGPHETVEGAYNHAVACGARWRDEEIYR